MSRTSRPGSEKEKAGDPGKNKRFRDVQEKERVGSPSLENSSSSTHKDKEGQNGPDLLTSNRDQGAAEASWQTGSQDALRSRLPSHQL